MSRAKTFKLFDVKRAWEATRAANIAVDHMDIDTRDGTIRIFPKNNSAEGGSPNVNEWDEVLANGAAAEIR